MLREIADDPYSPGGVFGPTNTLKTQTQETRFLFAEPLCAIESAYFTKPLGNE